MRVIGLMSGTSIDGIDAALVEISGEVSDLKATLIAGQTYSYTNELRSRILAACSGTPLSIEHWARLDDDIAYAFAAAAGAINQGHDAAALIGSHGQTVFHRPPQTSELGYTVQLGRGAVIRQVTQIATVSNFRVADIALGGQGAPLVPPVDAALLSHPTQHRCIQNIGGMGNVTYLPPQEAELGLQKLLGWDTGPGNVLIDLAVWDLSKGEKTYDRDGTWAASGQPCTELVTQWLQQPFFLEPPPKSTGREQFGREYLSHCLAQAHDRALNDANILATLTDLSAASIAHSYRNFLPQLPDQVLVCGGGSRNHYLLNRLRVHLPNAQVTTTDCYGINADYKEAIAFAVLAYWHHVGIPGNAPAVTGATHTTILGEMYS